MNIDLKKIIEGLGIDEQEVAEELFPMHNYPNLALTRIFKGDGVLDANQIARFCTRYQVPVEKLFSTSDWKLSTENHTHTLSNGVYKALLNIEDMTTRVFKNGSLECEFVLHSSTITLSQYVQQLNTEIFKINNK